MGLFNKLFRRKKTTGTEEVAPLPSVVAINSNQNNNSSRSRSSSLKNNEPVRITVRPPSSQGQHSQPARSGTAAATAGRSPTKQTNQTNLGSRDSHSTRERDVEIMGVLSPVNAAAKSQSEHVRVLSPRSQGSSGGPINNNMNVNKFQITTGKQDNENVNHSISSGGSSLSPRLSHQQLQQFDLQNNGLSPPNHPAPTATFGGGPGNHPSMYTMPTDIPRGQMQAMDDMNRSDASSSSFNLSTDAEDSEYETLRRRGVIPRSHRSKLESSNFSLSGVSQNSPLGLHDDERLFAGLHDDLTLSTSQSGTEAMAALQRLGMSTVPLYQGPPAPYQPIPVPKPNNEQQPVAPTYTYKKSPPPKQQQNNQLPHKFALHNETDEDLRAWNISPSTAGSNREPSTSTKSAASQNHRMFNFENSSSPPSHHKGGDDGLTIVPRSTSGPVDPPASTTSRSSMTASSAVRNFTSPKSRASPSSASGFSPDPDFATFVDFNAFGSNVFAAHGSNNKNKTMESAPSWRDEKKTPEMAPPPPPPPPPPPAVTRRPMPQEFADPEQPVVADTSPRESSTHNSNNFSSSSHQYANSLPGGGSDTSKTSLSELLAQAKNKQRRGGGTTSGSRSNHRTSGRASSSSVNSAPAITASFLRQHHNLGKYSTSTTAGSSAGGGGSSFNVGGTNNSFNDGTSVSDIIQSLEATNQTRMKSGGARHSFGHRSVGDIGAVSTARAVKERLREKRRKEREFGVQNNRSPEGSSSENSDNEASESWLFDEVTGALGPRGIAADLESLSGRSNRSKNSQGNKSHRSHRSKSRRSRPGSSSRRNKSSGDSVDSPGSRTSRNSRYSHRSTKSFMSQMSEQSRSVANDLLRLEMQLAMVGAGNETRDDVSARMGGGSVSGTSAGGASSRMSRNGRKSSTPHTRSSPSNSGVQAISSATRRTKINVLAPPGKLGIILANKADSKGTVVSGVRTSSVLVDAISPGDRIVAIDGEDVSRMTVSEITTIMSRKADYERALTVLTIPKQTEQHFGGQHQYQDVSQQHTQSGMISPTHVASTRSPTNGGAFVNDFSQYRR